MPNPLFNRFGNNYNNSFQNNNIMQQLAQIKRKPEAILDILLHNGKINQRQYQELQPYKNNPEVIVKYLINNGNGNEINLAEQTARQINGAGG